jgi:hypothetical protein
LLDRGSEDLAATRADRYLLILARLRALDAYDRAWGEDERLSEPMQQAAPIVATSER